MTLPQDPPVLQEAREDLLREAAALRGDAGQDAAASAESARSLTVFSLGAEWYAVDLVHVRRILRPVPIARVPGASPEVLGLMNCHGEVLAILDLRKLLGLGTTEAAAARDGRLVVVLHFGRREAGVIVDAVGDICDVRAQDVRPVLESLEPSRARLFEGTIAREGRLVGLLNVSMCLNP